MERWINKVAVVTGASSGIGDALVKCLVEKNIKVVGLARRIDKMEKLKNELKNKKGIFYPIQCDLSDERDILKAFKWIEINLKSVDILVNNAAISNFDLFLDSPMQKMKNIMEVNLIAPTICTREAVRIMLASNIAGHIININSISGQNVIFLNNATTLNMYSPSKFALKAVAQVVELELEHVKSHTKVTTIFPGLVKTEMPPKELFNSMPYVDAKDVTDSVMYALSTPPHVQDMERWINKVAVVTGASSGIGAAIVKALVKRNVKVVGLARRIDKMEKLKNELRNEKGSFYPINCDLRTEEDILKAFQWIEKNFKRVDILVNNAGVFKTDMCIESSTDNMKTILDVNLLAPTICIREAVRIMRANNIAGHIVNINSVLGQITVLFNNQSHSMYCPSKFGLKAVAQMVELELQRVNSYTKVTTIFPALVKTDMPPEDSLNVIPYIDAEDVSESVIYALSTPPHVQIKELTITAVSGFVRKTKN